MKKQDLRKLSRLDLIEMLLALTKENEQLRTELEDARRQLADRRLAVENAGTLAEATLRLNGVFESAEAAAEQYLENIRLRSEQQSRACAQMEQETLEKCNRMIRSAKEQVDDFLRQVNSRLLEISNSYSWKAVTPDDAADSGPQDK